MINMMYLVLTALLALNVSAEILNAFRTVNNSLDKSNRLIDESNNAVTEQLGQMLEDPNLATRAKIYKPKADSALAITKEVSIYINNLKEKLMAEAGKKEGDSTYKENDLDAATRLFEKQGEGEKLYKVLEKFKNDVLAVLPKEIAQNIEKDLPIDLSMPKTQNAGNNTWTAAYFRMTPAIAGITILSKFDNDVKRTGNIVANKCLEQVGKVKVIFNKFEPLVSQNTEYTLPGQPIKISAGLGALSTDNLPTVTINGVSRPVDPRTGLATWETTASGGGDQSVKVVISFVNPNTGEKEIAEKIIKYTVGQPSGASIFLEKMNVMYIGVDNPLTISSGTGKAESMKVSFTGGSISPAGGGGKYIAKPTTPGPATVNVSIEGRNYPFPIRVKYLPDPVPVVGQLSGGKMPSAQFKAMGGLRAVLKDSEFDAPFTVISYTLAGIGQGFQQYTPVQITGSQWGSNAVISNCRPGSQVFFDDIIVKGPDGKNRKLPSISFQLQ
jgi:gliding motility-associated protein GldM